MIESAVIKRVCAGLAGLGAAVLMVGCGGSGDSGSPQASATVTLSTANQDAVARAAANAALSSAQAASAAPLSADRAQAAASSAQAQPQTNARSLTRLLFELALQAVNEPAAIKTAQRINGTATTLAVTTRTASCAAGGSVTIALDDRDNNNAASPGDVASITFNQCQDRAGHLSNGSLSATYTVVQSGTSSASASATVTFSNLTATSSEGSFAINGAFSFNFARQGVVTTAQFSVGGSGLSAAVSTPSYNDTITLGAGYAASLSYDPDAMPPASTVAGLTTLAINGSISAASIGGTVVISTPAAFKQYDIDAFPREGQLQVRGANNGLLLVTTQSTTTVRIQLDANGDGTFETTKDVPWSVLI